MSNPFPHNSPGSIPPSSTSPATGPGTGIPRRSSYASVLAGGRQAATAAIAAAAGTINTTEQHAQQSRTSPFAHLAGNTPTSSAMAHSYPPPQSQNTARSFEIPQPHSRRHPSESWDKPGHTALYSGAPGSYGAGCVGSGTTGDAYGVATGENRLPDLIIPSYLRGSRHAERLEEKHRARIAPQGRDTRSGRSSNGGSLSTSASSHNLHKMVPSHRGMTFDIQENPYTRPEDIVAPLPTRWSTTDKFQGLEVSADGTEIKFAGTTKTQDEAAAVRSDHCMPRECGMFYFEVTILGKTKDGLIGIGFSGPKVDLNRIPGWGPESWAYHGDDGHTFSQSSTAKIYGPKFGSLDVVGCGVNFRNGTAFFTLNGVNLGPAFKDIRATNLYPSIGLKKVGEHVRVNFGQHPFVFDIDGLMAKEKRSIGDQILKESAKNLHHSGNEDTLLQELVAQYLAHGGYIETAKAFTQQVRTMSSSLHGPSHASSKGMDYKEDLDAINRQRIRSAILDGDIDKALKYTNVYYPSVLQDNENIYFKLRCRKFVEMIRRCNDVQTPFSKSKRQSSSYSNGNGSFGRTMSNGHSQNTSQQHQQSTGNTNSSHINQDDYADVFDGHMELDEEDTFRLNSVSGDGIGQTGMKMDLEPTVGESEIDLMSAAVQYGQELRAEFKDDPRKETKDALEKTFALIAYPDARDSSLAPLLEIEGRAPVAEELNSAILVSQGKSSSAALERLIQQTEVLVNDQAQEGRSAAFINVTSDFVRGPFN